MPTLSPISYDGGWLEEKVLGGEDIVGYWWAGEDLAERDPCTTVAARSFNRAGGGERRQGGWMAGMRSAEDDV